MSFWRIIEYTENDRFSASYPITDVHLSEAKRIAGLSSADDGCGEYEVPSGSVPALAKLVGFTYQAGFFYHIEPTTHDED